MSAVRQELQGREARRSAFMAPTMPLTVRHAYEVHYAGWAPDLSDNARIRYHYDLLRWERATPNPEVWDISTEHFVEFRALSKSLNHSADTTEQTIRTVRQILNCCHALGIVKDVPHPGKPRPIVREEPEPPTPEEFERLYLAAGATTWPRLHHVHPQKFWQSWMVVDVWTCLRLSDITWTLEWSHVQEDLIRFRQSKKKKLHQIPMCDVVKRHLHRVKNMRWEYVFGPANSPKHMRREIARMCEVAGLNRVLTPHDFRRAGITFWSIADGTAGQIMHGVGLPGVLSRYQHAIQILRAAAARFPWPDAVLKESREFRQLTLF